MLAGQMTYSIDIQLLGSLGETPLDDLSKLVHLRAGQKPISDARTATYVILSTGSGPGGRWFKSIRSHIELHRKFFLLFNAQIFP